MATGHVEDRLPQHGGVLLKCAFLTEVFLDSKLTYFYLVSIFSSFEHANVIRCLIQNLALARGLHLACGLHLLEDGSICL